jgi:heparanase 1
MPSAGASPAALLLCALLALPAPAAAQPPPLPPSWAVYPGLNAVPHCPSTCTSSGPFRCLGLFPGATPQPCFAACLADAACSQATWAADDGRCFTRTDGAWALVGGATAAACNNATVAGCIPPPPANNSVLRAAVAAAPSGVRLHALAPAVTLDGWNASLFPRWGSGSYLALDLEQPRLLALAGALAPGLLRLGGSPEDSILFDASGSGCAAGSGGGGPAPGGYYCSQVRPYVYGCLTGARWEALLAFAARTGLQLVLGVNGCFGRLSADSAMDFSNIRALLAATAASPHRAALHGLELSNEVFGTSISPAAWGADMETLRALVAEALGAPLAVLAGPDDASPAHLAQALNATRPGTLQALTYHHYPGCLANASAYFALDPRCLAVIDEWGARFSSAAGAPAGVATWAGETAGHGGGGVSGLTDSFTSSLYYAWQLGALPLAGVELSARQALVGGDYELLSHARGLAPNPDYWVVWLFKALVGSGAQAHAVNVSAAATASGVRVFAFSGGRGAPAPRALLALSLNTVGARIGVELGGGGAWGGARVEYHLQGPLGVPGGGVACNGRALGVGAAGELPDWRALGAPAAAGSALQLAPSSVVFATL